MSDIVCRRCGETRSALDSSPLPGKWGPIVVASTCGDCWLAWIEEQTRLINHERLLPSDAEHRKVLYQRMVEYLKLEART